MPTIAHVIVGLAAGRVYARRDDKVLPSMAAGCVISCWPDLDLIAVALGAEYGSALDHRSATHSLFSAVAVAAVVALVAFWRRIPVRRAFAFALVTGLSHGLLDVLNFRSKVALLWPFSTSYIGSPWQPIPAVATLAELTTSRIFPVMLSELLIFSPLLIVIVWWPRLQRGAARRLPE
ncbi:MAG: metal-dependent hydrolase [Gemmatimonadota bacterium]